MICHARSSQRRAAAASRAGLTLLENLMTLGIMVVTVLGMAQALLDSMTTNTMNREVAVATDGARRVISDLQGADFGSIFALYNSSQTGNTLGGQTISAGAFAIDGLTPVNGDADGMVGQILLPESTNFLGTVELREDLDNARFGMPRDLDGNGTSGDALDHSGDYQVLPVVIEVDWRGPKGPAHVEFKTVLSRY